jgi:hypothetical protein
LLSTNIKTVTYKAIISPGVLYGCGTWPVTLRVFENRVLKKVTGRKQQGDRGKNY